MKSDSAILHFPTVKSSQMPILSLLLVIFILFSRPIFAQETPPPEPLNPSNQEKQDTPKPKTDWSKKFFTGGGLGLQFGSYTYIGLSPILGYHFTPKFSGGVGITYIYLRDRANNLSTSIYGGKIFAEYDVYRGISPHVEYELLNLEIFDNFLLRRRRINVDSFLVGVSYQQEIGAFSSIYIMVLYNLLENVYSPYINPVLRIGFNVGL